MHQCLTAWKEFEPYEVVATTYQAISGAGKTFKDWPEMIENIIPYIGGEEEKVRKGATANTGEKMKDGVIVPADRTCDHMPVYPCSGTERTYSSCICKIPKETNQRTADRETCETSKAFHRN